MKHDEFKIGAEFACGDKRWRCTDIGSRTIVAICISGADVVRQDCDGQHTVQISGQEAAAQGWFNGPPYAVAEHVFDEFDVEGCEPVEDKAAA